MAKKSSVSANHVLIDVPMGPEVKAVNKKEAKHLKKMYEMVGRKIGMNVRVIITDGTQPIGNGIGPLLEARDVMKILRNDEDAPIDLREKALLMAGLLLKMAGVKRPKKTAKEILESGKALVKMNEIIKAQGRVKKVELGEHKHIVRSGKSGRIKKIDNKIISKVATVAGAPQDKGSGLYLEKHVKDSVRKGEVLYTVYAENKFKLGLAKEFIKKGNGFTI